MKKLSILILAVVVLGLVVLGLNKNGGRLGSITEYGYTGTSSASSTDVGYAISGGSQTNTSSTISGLHTNRRYLEVCNKSANSVTICRSAASSCVFGSGVILHGTSTDACRVIVNDTNPYWGVVSVSVNATTSSSSISVIETIE